MKDLEKVLTEQIFELEVNEISLCEMQMNAVYLNRREKDDIKWLEI